MFLNLRGYHGTSKEAYYEIKKHGFKNTHRNDHWLGQGIYFFQDDLDKAEWFSTQCKSVKYGKGVPCVIKAVIKVEEKRFLNMCSSNGFQKFEKAYEEFKKNIYEFRINIEFENNDAIKNEIVCVIYDNIENIDVISNVFPNDSYISHLNKEICTKGLIVSRHTQLCVKKLSCIKNISIVK